MKLTEEQKQKLCDEIERSLCSAKLRDGYPLIDHLTPDCSTIAKGKEEIKNIVEHIYFDLDDWDF